MPVLPVFLQYSIPIGHDKCSLTLPFIAYWLISIYRIGTNEWHFSYWKILAAAAKSLHSCPTLCDPIDGSPPGSPVPGILQARTLEWVAMSFSNAWKWRLKVKSLSHVRLYHVLNAYCMPGMIVSPLILINTLPGSFQPHPKLRKLRWKLIWLELLWETA